METNDMTSEPNRPPRPKPDSIITSNHIVSVHPKSLTIKVKHYGCRPATVNLPITEKLYRRMIKVVASSAYINWLPLTFYLNNQGVAYDLMPLKFHMAKEAEKTEKAKNDKDSPKSNH
jgi:hypothetical protein